MDGIMDAVLSKPARRYQPIQPARRSQPIPTARRSLKILQAGRTYVVGLGLHSGLASRGRRRRGPTTLYDSQGCPGLHYRDGGSVDRRQLGGRHDLARRLGAI